jgi:peptide/nickel transport system substrate-binding protein
MAKQPLSNIPNTRGWWFQMNNPKWQDERIRRAISLAFDRNAFDESQGGDNLNPDGAFSFISTPPWPTIFDSYPTAAVQGPWYKFDPEQASQLMQAAGYSVDNPLTFEIVGWYQRSIVPTVAIPLISETLPEAVISWREVDNPTHATLMADRNFEDALGYLIPSFLSFDMCTYPWYHTNGATNYNNTQDADMDRMLEAQRQESDLAARREIWQQIWDRVHDQVWEIAYPANHQRAAWHNYVLNYRPHSWIGAYGCYSNYQAETMWLDEGAPMRG